MSDVKTFLQKILGDDFTFVSGTAFKKVSQSTVKVTCLSSTIKVEIISLTHGLIDFNEFDYSEYLETDEFAEMSSFGFGLEDLVKIGTSKVSNDRLNEMIRTYISLMTTGDE